MELFLYNENNPFLEPVFILSFAQRGRNMNVDSFPRRLDFEKICSDFFPSSQIDLSSNIVGFQELKLFWVWTWSN